MRDVECNRRERERSGSARRERNERGKETVREAERDAERDRGRETERRTEWGESRRETV